MVGNYEKTHSRTKLHKSEKTHPFNFQLRKEKGRRRESPVVWPGKNWTQILTVHGAALFFQLRRHGESVSSFIPSFVPCISLSTKHCAKYQVQIPALIHGVSQSTVSMMTVAVTVSALLYCTPFISQAALSSAGNTARHASSYLRLLVVTVFTMGSIFANNHRTQADRAKC